jgi:hypothetical protein
MRRKTVVVRINEEVYKKAVEEAPKSISYMDTKELLSYLVMKGLQKVKEEENVG